MAQVRAALGHHSAEQHFPAIVPSSGGLVGLVSAGATWKAIVRRRLYLASVIFFACITPWLVRNYQTFGKFIFIRDNFGAELRLGNGNGADGTWMEYLHPTQDVYAMRQYQSLGEPAYVAMRKRQAVAYIRSDYARFTGLCAKRFIYYWAGPPKATQPWWMSEVKNSLFLASSVLMFWGLGRALRLRRPGAWLLFWLILLCPAIYYVVFPMPRYRHPIEPEMAILGVFLLTEVGKRTTASDRVRSSERESA